MNVLARIGIAVVLALTVPLYYFLGASAGFVPWFGILLISLLPAFRLGNFVLAVNVLHLLIYALALFLLAYFVQRVIASLQRRQARVIATLLFTVASLSVGSLPLYSISHASEPDQMSAAALYLALWRGHIL